MTNFSNIIYLHPHQIQVPENRQRKDIDISDIKESILKNGIINPIIVQRPDDSSPYILIAGERRFEACKQLNLLIPCRLKENLLPSEAEVLEFEENHKRKNLTWREEVKAIGSIHQSYLNQNKNHTQQETALTLSIDQKKLSQTLFIFENIDQPILSHANNFSQAYDLLNRFSPQKSEEIKKNVKSILDKNKDLPSYLKPLPPPSKTKEIPLDLNYGDEFDPKGEIYQILNQDFTIWIRDYSGPRFNFLHIDFPQESNLFWPLTNSLFGNLSKILSPHSHILFWLDPSHFPSIIKHIQSTNLLSIFPRPLIWYKSDTKSNQTIGQPPKPTYECALILTSGERQFKRQIQDAYHTPRSSQPICPNQKPIPMLKYFFQTFIDSDTHFLDPTCGSGSSLIAAEELKSKSILGLESNRTIFLKANEKILRSRELNQILSRK